MNEKSVLLQKDYQETGVVTRDLFLQNGFVEVPGSFVRLQSDKLVISIPGKARRTTVTCLDCKSRYNLKRSSASYWERIRFIAEVGWPHNLTWRYNETGTIMLAPADCCPFSPMPPWKAPIRFQ